MKGTVDHLQLGVGCAALVDEDGQGSEHLHAPVLRGAPHIFRHVLLDREGWERAWRTYNKEA